MKAAVVTSPGKLDIQEVPDPKWGDYDVLVEMLACGLCGGTDSKILSGHWPGVGHYPVVLGHEGVGRVIAKGKKVKSFKIGDVILRPGLEKVEDPQIRSAWGAFAQYGVASDWQAMADDAINEYNPLYLSQQKIPTDMDPIEATMLITLKETLSGLQAFGVKEGSTVLICGDGPVGVCMTQFARLLGAKLLVVAGHWDERLKRAKALGADYTINSAQLDLLKEIKRIAPRGVDFVIDAAGNNQVIREGLRLIANNGKVAVYGVSGEPHMELDWSMAPYHWSMEHMFFPNFPLESATHEPILRWIKEGVIKPRELITHVLPLESITEAFELVKSREAFKVVIVIGK